MTFGQFQLVGAVIAGVLTLGLTTTVSGTARAQTVSPERCQFEGGFAAFRESVGGDVVGSCRANQTFDANGNAFQPTSRGSLTWNARFNDVTFHESSRILVSGPGGIGTNVRIGGLRDGDIEHEPIRASAARVMGLASVRPIDLGSGWSQAGSPPGLMPQAHQLSCAPRREDTSLGSVLTMVEHSQKLLAATHLLTAVPEHAENSLRDEMNGIVKACDNQIDQVGPASFRSHLRVEPFVDLGDESLLLHVDIEHEQTGDRRELRIGYVRYGGLTSIVMVMNGINPAVSGSLDDLEMLARAADARVQHAAWFLRP
jgi:hypothetical protein